MRDDELLAAMWRAFQAAEHVGHPDGPMAAILAVVREHDGRDAWQPIETAPHMRKIIVHYLNDRGRHRVVMACFYEAGALEMHDDYQDVGIWDEESGTGFAPAGWYEEHDSDDPIMPLGGEPDHWMPLPAPPSTRRRHREGEGMSAQRDCIHGHLARSCELCAAQNDHATACEQIDRLRAELAALRAERDALRAAGKDALHALTSSRVFVTSRERCHHPDGTAWYDERVERLRAALGER